MVDPFADHHREHEHDLLGGDTDDDHDDGFSHRAAPGQPGDRDGTAR
jgi:hypothetical protein